MDSNSLLLCPDILSISFLSHVDCLQFQITGDLGGIPLYIILFLNLELFPKNNSRHDIPGLSIRVIFKALAAWNWWYTSIQ